VCVFEVLFKEVSTRFGRPMIENSFKNACATICSAVQNLRLGTIKFVKNGDELPTAGLAHYGLFGYVPDAHMM
jgi:hypothetical protein